MSRLQIQRGGDGGRGVAGAIKRPGGPSVVADCFSLAKSDPVLVHE